MLNKTYFIDKTLATVLIALVLVSSLQAQTRTAINNGLWTDTANWDCSCIPGPGEDIVIGDALTITVNGNVTINNLTVNNLAQFTIWDTLWIDGSVTIAGAFNNNNVVYIAGDITNNGALTGGTVAGGGTYCVSGVSTNTQSMLGPMDFCDLTPPATAPFVDNPGAGFIQPNVTFCQSGICDPSTGPVASLIGINQATIGQCDGAAAGSASGGTPPYVYLWDDPAAQTTASAVGLCAGDFLFIVTDAMGLQDTITVTITEAPPANIEEDYINSSTIEVTYGYGLINVTVNSEKYSNMNLELVDLRGRIVWTTEITASENVFKPNEKLKGIFLYRISDSSEILDQGKLLLK